MVPRDDSAPGTLSFFKTGEQAHPQPAPGLSAGKVIGDFRLVEMIGQGGMGQVWEAAQVSLGNRRVAVKFVRPERVTEKQLSYFEREARAGGRLAHPGIVAVHGFGESDGVAWIAMELVEGCWTLRDFLDETARANELPADYDREVARFVGKLAGALQAAHEGGVIHRDLKPQNVMITPGNEPKVTDFGLARITDESALSQTGDFAGTYYYMSPEQVAAKRMGIDHRTDVFSLGVVMYEMLTLRRPFQGDTSHQIAQQIVLHDPPDMRAVRSKIPRDLSVICGKALEKGPEKRYATMAELGADIGRHLANEPIRARPPTQVERLVKWTKRNPTKSAASAVATLAFVVISALGLRISKQRDDLESTNTALEIKTEEAEASASLARDNAAEAERKAADVLRLSLAQDYADLMLDADALWPAYPERIGEFRVWVSEATDLLGQLPSLVAKRDELRALALPQTEDERRAERESHAEYGKLGPLRAEIDARSRALAVRLGESELELPVVEWSAYPGEAGGLNDVAWPLVDPDREAYGQEALGLVLAIRAAELASEEERAGILDSVAWGRFAVGDDEGALSASRAALEAAAGEKREEFAGYLAKVEGAVRDSSSDEGLSLAETAIAELESSYAQIEARVDERRAWVFPEGQEEETRARWWHNQLTGLIGELESLVAAGTGLLTEDGVSVEHGLSVARRLAFAERLESGFAPGGEFARRWADAQAALEESYPGLDLGVQMGLVPIGPDPGSGLWEFWHVQSGEELLRGEDRELELEEGSGLVLVLLRGGTFWMGAQSGDPGGRNYDPQADSNEGPVHEVELSSFFLSKYEMTQGQWERISGRNPSRYGPSSRFLDYEHDLTHPVEQVSWLDCVALLPNIGLIMPSEAQWEYGARGLTDTVWWTGSDRESLRTVGAVNLADQAAARAGASWVLIKEWPELDDGFVVHAPVDAYAANAFGLHNVHGNVWEWCLDGYDGGFYGGSPVHDPVSPYAGSGSRVSRGGSFVGPAIFARSANRRVNTPSLAVIILGLRPARVITD